MAEGKPGTGRAVTTKGKHAFYEDFTEGLAFYGDFMGILWGCQEDYMVIVWGFQHLWCFYGDFTGVLDFMEILGRLYDDFMMIL